jgi:alkanesulfonate monooxygenase
MIGVTPPSNDATLHVIEGGLSPNYLTQFARAHDEAGFDLALVGHTSSSAEGFLVALYAAAHTNRLGYLVAHRPGFVAPTLMARKIATFDHLSGGRLAVHIITGKTDEEQWADGDFSPKAERYRRAAEYLELMKLTWSSERPFDFAGKFYRVRGAASDVRPLQQPHPLLFFGGASEGALSMGAKLCDVYAIYAEPLASTRERITQFRSMAAAFGRMPGFNVSVRPIIAAREGEAWDKANRILAGMSGKKGWRRQEETKGPVDNAGQRLMRFALERDVPRRALVDADCTGHRRARQHVVPCRHSRANRGGAPQILHARRGLVPHSRLRPPERCDRVWSRADSADQGWRP